MTDILVFALTQARAEHTARAMGLPSRQATNNLNRLRGLGPKHTVVVVDGHDLGVDALEQLAVLRLVGVDVRGPL